MQLCVGKEMNNLHVPVERMSGNLPPPGGCLAKMLQLSVVLYDVVMYDTLYVICNVCVFLIFGIFCVCGFLQLCLWFVCGFLLCSFLAKWQNLFFIIK